MEVNKTIKQLEFETSSLGIQVTASGKNGRLMKKDYIEPLMLYNLLQRYGDLKLIPMNVKFRLSFYCPQLAYGYFDLNVIDQEQIWKSPDIWLTEKINGVRGTLVHSKEGYNCFSRALDDNFYMYTDYIGKVLEPQVQGLARNAVFDIEITVGNRDVVGYLHSQGYEAGTDFQTVSTLLMMQDEVLSQVKENFPNLFKFKLLDIYFWDKDIRKLNYRERESLFDSAVDELRQAQMNVDRPLICKDVLHKKAFHEGVMAKGGEGTIAVYADTPCVLDGSRKKGTWIKIKRSLFAVTPDSLTDTVDGWVSGIDKDPITGITRSLTVSAYDQLGKESIIANVSAIPLSIRLKDIQIGDVVELSGEKWENGCILDAVLERLRHDKSVADCVLKIS